MDGETHTRGDKDAYEFDNEQARLLANLQHGEWEELLERPWLAAFVDVDADYDHDGGFLHLEPARQRWAKCQRETKRQLRAAGIQVEERMTTADGLRTTALRPPEERLVRR